MFLCPRCHQECSPLIVLTNTERAVLKSFLHGLSVVEMAELHYISYHTISTHLVNIRKKFGLAHQRLIYIFAAKHGLYTAIDAYDGSIELTDDDFKDM